MYLMFSYFLYNFIYLILADMNMAYSLVVMCRLLIVVVSLVAAHMLSCSVACEISPNQESNLCLLHRQADSLPLSHQVSPK